MAAGGGANAQVPPPPRPHLEEDDIQTLKQFHDATLKIHDEEKDAEKTADELVDYTFSRGKDLIAIFSAITALYLSINDPCAKLGFFLASIVVYIVAMLCISGIVWGKFERIKSKFDFLKTASSEWESLYTSLCTHYATNSRALDYLEAVNILRPKEHNLHKHYTCLILAIIILCLAFGLALPFATNWVVCDLLKKKKAAGRHYENLIKMVIDETQGMCAKAT